MTSRQTRRTAAVLAIVAAVSVTTAAATQRQHHSGFFGVDWIAGMVVGARYVLLMCGVALAVLARGLLYGKRTARRLTLVCILVAADGLRGHAHHIVPIVALALLGAVLVVGRGAFSAGTNPVQARQGWWILVAGECTVLLYGVVGLHMLEQVGKHAGFDLRIAATGDLHIDTHHTVEDVALSLGEAFRQALGDKAGVRRFASGLYPLDEALVEVALDLSGRPFVVWDVELPESLPLGNPAFDPQLAEHAVSSFATAAGITLHVTLRRGRNVHHIIEAVFKGLARCLRDAVRVEGAQVPSTKGVL